MSMQHSSLAVAPMVGAPPRTERFMRDITQELESGSVSFPTSIDATLRIRRMIDDPGADADHLARAVATEPLLAAKLVRLANSAALRVAGAPVADVRAAVLRVGLTRIRTLSIAVAIDQLVQARHMAPVLGLARDLWEHSIQVAALAYALGRKLTAINPDELMYAGIVHDIGQFYLLSRAVEYPELLDGDAELSALMFDFHKEVGRAVLESLGTPESVIQAVEDHELYGSGFPPRRAGDVLYLANRMSPVVNPFARGEEGAPDAASFGEHAEVIERLVAQSRAEIDALIGALRA